MKTNFRNPAFKHLPPLPNRPPAFIPVLKLEIEIDAAGNTRVNRPSAWSNEQFALFLVTLAQGALNESLKENSMIIDPNKPADRIVNQAAGQDALTCEEVSSDVS